MIGSYGTVYRIKLGTSGNIEWIKPDGTCGRTAVCASEHDEQWLPTADVMAAQVLALMTDERQFWRIANVHRDNARRFWWRS